jgi:hypothetical protein
MCSVRFTISTHYRKDVERHLKTARPLGHLRQVQYLLAILAVMDGQSFVEGAVVLRVHERTGRRLGTYVLLLWTPGRTVQEAHGPPAQAHPDADRSSRQTHGRGAGQGGVQRRLLALAHDPAGDF